MKKMGQKFLLGTAMAAAVVTASGCNPVPTGVYGPPSYFETATDELNTEETASETVFETETETETESVTVTITEPESQKDITIETNAPVYGPPEDLETYDPESEINEDVYGPPEWFN
mgnify:CR=1 FL=1